jgi:hypothetical protein
MGIYQTIPGRKSSEHYDKNVTKNTKVHALKLIKIIPSIVLDAKPIPVDARSKAWVCGRSLSGIVGSNPNGDMDICLLCALCVVR